VTDADRIEFLTNQLRFYKEMALRLHQEVQAAKRIPENHKGRSITWADPTGNRGSANADRSKGRK
jgi:hypothetical protein